MIVEGAKRDIHRALEIQGRGKIFACKRVQEAYLAEHLHCCIHYSFQAFGVAGLWGQGVWHRLPLEEGVSHRGQIAADLQHTGQIRTHAFRFMTDPGLQDCWSLGSRAYGHTHPLR